MHLLVRHLLLSLLFAWPVKVVGTTQDPLIVDNFDYLDLDFESSLGWPEFWTVYAGPDSNPCRSHPAVFLSTKETKTGNQSLAMIVNPVTECVRTHVGAYNVIPGDRIRGQRVKISAWVKAKNLRPEQVYLWWSGFPTQNDENIPTNFGFIPQESNGDWTQISGEFQAAPNLTHAQFGVAVSNGEAHQEIIYFDDIQIEYSAANGTNTICGPSEVKELYRSIHDLEVSPGKGISNMKLFTGQADFSALDFGIRDARLISLGEPIHASGGFYRAKAEMIKHLISERGFRVLLVEDNWPIFDQVCKESPRSSLSKMYQIWQDRSILELLEWICDYNSTHQDDPVAIHGFDMKEIATSLELVKEYLRRINGSMDSHLESNINLCGTQMILKEFISALEYDVCKEAFEQINKLLASNHASLPVRLAANSLSYAVSFYYFSGDSLEWFHARDLGMAENIKIIANDTSYLNKKAIIWAHNMHIASQHEKPGPIMGKKLKQFFKGDYYSIGLIGYQIETPTEPDYFLMWPSPMLPNRESLEGKLERLGIETLFLDLRPYGDAINPVVGHDAYVFIRNSEKMDYIGPQ